MTIHEPVSRRRDICFGLLNYLANNMWWYSGL